jgi:pyruvate dehydrogenase E1 component alpha subunit
MNAWPVTRAAAGGGLAQAEELGLDRDGLVRLYRAMVLTRALDDRGLALYKQGKLPGSFYTSRGNEAAAVGVGGAMGPDDVGTPLHRNLGTHVVRGVEPWRVLCQFMGRVDGQTRGRDSNLRTQDLDKGLIAGVSHLPGILPAAIGIALAFKLRGEPRVALGWCGDGASSRGDAHETMNFAGVRRLPLVFVIDNNQFAYSTPTNLNFACESLAERAASYGFEGIVVDGTDLLAVYRETQRALEKARTGGGPTLLELMTLRMHGHAVHDDAAYVPPELLAEWEKRDPIARFRAWLEAEIEWSDDEQQALEAELQAVLDDAVARADASPWPDPAELVDGVYAV